MKPALRNLLLGSAATGSQPSGTSAVAKLKGHTSIITQPIDYEDPHVFINMMRQGSGFFVTNGQVKTWPPYALDTGWFANIPAGASATNWIFSVGEAGGFAVVIKTGDYIMTSTSGMSLKLTSWNTQTFINVVQGTAASPNCTFTVTDGARGVIWIAAVNETGAPIAAMSDLYVGLVRHKAAHDAGEIFDPDYLARMGNPSAMRYNDLTSLNFGYYEIGLSTIPTEANANWTVYSRQLDRPTATCGMPPSVCVKLAKKTDSLLWYGVPLGAVPNYSYTTNAATGVITTIRANDSGLVISAHNWLDGKPVYFGYSVAPGITRSTRYYIRDVTASTFKISTTLGGTPVNLPTDGVFDWYRQVFSIDQPDPRAYYAALADIFFTVWPQANVLIEVGNESWNATYEANYIQTAGPGVSQKWSANGGVAYSGDVAVDLARALAWYQTMAWKAMETRSSRAQNVRAITQQTGTGLMNGYYDWVSTDFEPGRRFVDMLDGIFSAAYFMPITNTVQQFADGAVNWTMQQWITYYREALFAALEDSKNLRANMPPSASAIKRYTYEAGYQAQGGQGTLTSAQYISVETARRVFMHSEEAGTLFGEFVQRVFKNEGTQNSMIWWASGWFGDTYAWGLNEYGAAPASPAALAVIDVWKTPTAAAVAPVLSLNFLTDRSMNIKVPYTLHAETWRLEWRTTAGPGAWVSAAGAFTKDNFELIGLGGGTNYDISAFADNSFGPSARSAILTRQTDPALAVLFSDDFAGTGALQAGYTLTNGSLWQRVAGQLQRITEPLGLCLRTVASAKYMQFKAAHFDFIDAIFRYVDANNYWKVTLGDNVRRIVVTKVVAGVSSDIAFSSVNVTDGNDLSQIATQVFRIEWQDSTTSLTVKRNGAVIHSLPGLGSNLTNGGASLGFYVNAQGGAQTYNVIDDLEIGG